MTAAGFTLLALSFGAAALRWLRVAQREHYLAGSSLRFAARWWRAGPLNVAAFALAGAGTAAAMAEPVCSVLVMAVALGAPIGLGLRGRTSKLVWTRRLRVLASVTALLALMPVGCVLAVGSVGLAYRLATVVVFAAPVLVDLALAITAPLERRLGRRFVDRAAARLRRVAPLVVAITGSYGKTTTKGYVAHLLSASHSVVASPRSYNNRAGLARTVNEHLELGTEILIAEMGTYGPGEIAEMCSWLRPEIAVMTAIGPVHLERFGSLEVTLAAKAEITRLARAVVLNVDDERLATLVAPAEAEGRRVVRCSATDPEADLCVRPEGDALAVYRAGELVGKLVGAGSGLHAPANVACALGVVEAVGDDLDRAVERLVDLPRPPHRLSSVEGETGVEILDDTFNANPAGARFALGRLGALAASGRRVLVTPGMIELGPLQGEENRRLAALASELCTQLVIVGRTNRAALRSGAGDRLEIVVVRDRAEAVAWVRESLGDGDAVLYENDLPDHYP